MNYKQKLLDPRWQRKRLEILQRDEFTCINCCNSQATLHVHHYTYSANPWDTPSEQLATLCEECHKYEHERRPGIEKGLLEALKKNALSADFISDLSEGLSDMPKFHIEGVMGSVISWLLTNRQLLGEITDLYFESLKTKAQLANDDMPF